MDKKKSIRSVDGFQNEQEKSVYENSVQYLEKLKGKLEQIKHCDVESKCTDSDDSSFVESIQKSRKRKTIHTNRGNDSTVKKRENTSVTGHSGVGDANIENKKLKNENKTEEEILFRDKDDFALLDEGSEIDKERNENEQVYITKKEKKYLQDIGHLASKTRVPLDEKQQRFFDKDKKKFQLNVELPETQEKDKIPKEIISQIKEAPVNITSTELDGLKLYLVQLKELIARRETAWAKTTEKDYSQRVEITKFKNEVSHLRMLCDKRTREIREKDQIIQSKDEEIQDLNKKIQSLKITLTKFEKRESQVKMQKKCEMEDKSEGKLNIKPFLALKSSNTPKETNKEETGKPNRGMRSSVLKEILNKVSDEQDVKEHIERLDNQLKNIESNLMEDQPSGRKVSRPTSKTQAKYPEYRTAINGRPLPKKGLTSGSILKQDSSLGVLTSENGTMKGVTASTVKRPPSVFNKFQVPSSAFQQTFLNNNFSGYPRFT